MSVLAYIAFTCTNLPLVSGPVEILAEGSKHREIVALSMSPDGRYLLGSYGAGGRSDLLFLFHGNTFREVRMPVRPIGHSAGELVDNAGVIIGSYVARVKAGTMTRTIRVGNSMTETVPIAEPNPVDVGFEPHGVGADGTVYGTLHSGIEHMAAAWRGGEPHVVYSAPGHNLAIVPTSLGVLGTVARWVTQTRAEGELPVLFTRSGEATRLPLPRGYLMGRPMAANPSGSTILGTVSNSNGWADPIIWQESGPLVFRSPKGVQSQRLLGVTEDGRLAVGVRHMRSGSTPIFWEPENGLLTLEEFAKKKEISLPEDWTLLSAVCVSPGGEFIFGTAVNKEKLRRPFRLWLKERPKKVEIDG